MALDITGRKTTEDLMLYRATHDPLTGLLNHTAFGEEVERLCADPRQRKKKFALFFLDLDGFKKVNDVLGHRVGDGLLRLFAHRLQKAVRRTDLLVGVGGDKFVRLQKEIGGYQDTTRMERLLQGIMGEDFVVGNHYIRLSLSVGMALCPDDAQSLSRLMSIADSRMYQSKGTKAEEKLKTTQGSIWEK
ncbi:MAG: diguanylate cyclase domain-containing protein [Candidatus Caldatribacteriaceae bacterium]